LVEQADLLVMSSRHEADPIALLEGAVAGVPAVGTNVGHFVEWAPEAAAAVPVHDHAALAQSVVELLQDDRRRLALAEAAQARALRDNADRAAMRTMELYLALGQIGAEP
jgi:glycosyltransferase involved in cell wall biosynthesis